MSRWIDFENFPSTATPLSAENLNSLQDMIQAAIAESWKIIYPVGSIYISTNPNSPETLFGGRWEAFGQGRTLLGAGTPTANTNTAHGTITDEQLSWTWGVGDKGGGYTHTLTTAEMPSHKHSTSNDGGHNHNAYFLETRWASNYSGTKDLARPKSSGGESYQITNSTGTHNHTITNTGGSGAHNNIQPYIVTYMWRRLADNA